MKAYLAGPDVFLPNAYENVTAKVAICAKYGITGCSPLNAEIDHLLALPENTAWRAIYRRNVAMMEDCDIIIANLTPFRGASADAGTLIEVGWFLGRAKKIFGYSNTAILFTARCRAHGAAIVAPMPGLAVEDFGLPDNLMIPGAMEYGGDMPVTLPPDGRNRAFDALDVFEICVANAAKTLIRL